MRTAAPEPLLVSKLLARQLLVCGHAFLEQLIRDREILTVTHGARQKVVVSSLRDYIDRSAS
jgi:hypothetical protein